MENKLYPRAMFWSMFFKARLQVVEKSIPNAAEDADLALKEFDQRWEWSNEHWIDRKSVGRK